MTPSFEVNEILSQETTDSMLSESEHPEFLQVSPGHVLVPGRDGRTNGQTNKQNYDG